MNGQKYKPKEKFLEKQLYLGRVTAFKKKNDNINENDEKLQIKFEIHLRK